MVSGVTTDSPPLLPGPLRWAVRLLTGEAVALGLVAVFLVYEDLTGTATTLGGALVVTGFAAVGALLVFALARALAARRKGARGPAVVVQLMLLPIGFFMIQGGLAWLGVPVLALALTIGGCLVSPSTIKALGLDTRHP
ncbi:hypothetical protein WEI85_11815 [Actinomycetes bacterium KLBMP 9797]